MKTIIFFLLLTISSAAFSQTTFIGKDTLAKSATFQARVRVASLNTADAIVADSTKPLKARQYAQVLISDPAGIRQGVGWLAALTYGVIVNGVVSTTTDANIQTAVNLLFRKYAEAYFRTLQ